MREKGFTLVETVVVIAIMAILAAMIMPLNNRIQIKTREAKVRAELAEIGVALENYYYDKADFPASLSHSSFLGPYLFPGIDSEAITDDFSPGNNYTYTDYRSMGLSDLDLYCVNQPSYFALKYVGVTSVGDAEGLGILVDSIVPGRRRTRLKLDLIGAALAHFLFDAGTSQTLTGTWTSGTPVSGGDCWSMLMMDEFKQDGFGTSFKSTASTSAPMIYSYGSDLVDDSGTEDDITF